jgi:hypothetical protein
LLDDIGGELLECGGEEEVAGLLAEGSGFELDLLDLSELLIHLL